MAECSICSSHAWYLRAVHREWCWYWELTCEHGHKWVPTPGTELRLETHADA